MLLRALMVFAAAAAAATILPAAPASAADFVFPQSGPCTSNYYSSRPYGYHEALDIAGPDRSAITAARSGRIAFYGVNGGYGNLMIVAHDGGYTTYYGHLSGAARSAGTTVNAGDTIAYEGMTGHATGPHVHFEVRRYGTKLYVPGSVGTTFHRGNALPYDYPGIGDDAQRSSGGGSTPPRSGGTSAGDHLAFRVSASALNVRSGPSTSSSVIGLVYSGQVYLSDASNSGWRRVWFDGRQGWSSDSYLARTSATGRIINTDGLNVRTGPGTGYSVVAIAHRGERYAQAGTQGDWVQVYFGGSARWVSGGYTQTSGY